MALDGNGEPLSEQKTATNRVPCHTYVVTMQHLRDQRQQRIVHLGRDGSQSSKYGCTVFTKYFNAARRSWHLKIDFDASDNLSLYLLERGKPIYSQQSLNKVENCMIPNFSSVLFEFEVIHKTMINEKKTPIFFSFAHNTNQIVGAKNYLNLQSLANNEEIQINLYMRETPVLSALMQVLSLNFARCYNLATSQIQMEKQQNYFPSINLLTLPFPFIYHLLKSTSLKVQDENKVLGFLFNYIEENRHNQTDKSLRNIVNLLCHCMRYNFLDLDKILSALQRSEYFRGSVAFTNNLRSEMTLRVQISSLQSGCENKSSRGPDAERVPEQEINESSLEQDVLDEKRLHYDAEILKSQGRNKIRGLDGPNSVVWLLEEVVKWAMEPHSQKPNYIDRPRAQEQIRISEQGRDVRYRDTELLGAFWRDKLSQEKDLNNQIRTYQDKIEHRRGPITRDIYEYGRLGGETVPLGQLSSRQQYISRNKHEQERQALLKQLQQLSEKEYLQKQDNSHKLERNIYNNGQMNNLEKIQQQQTYQNLQNQQIQHNLPKYLQKTDNLHDKENKRPLQNHNNNQGWAPLSSIRLLKPHISSPMKPPPGYLDSQLADKKEQNGMLSADFSCILRRLESSPPAKRLNPQSIHSWRKLNRSQEIEKPQHIPQNPLIQAGEQQRPRTRIPVASNQQKEEGLLTSLKNWFNL